MPNLTPISPSNEFTQTVDLTSAGKPKAKAAEHFSSYEMYRAFCDHLLARGQIRDWSLLVIGIGTGLRVSDVVRLKLGHIYASDGEGNAAYRPYIDLLEMKTGHRTKNQVDAVLITQAVRVASDRLVRHYAERGIELNLDDYLFRSTRTNKNGECVLRANSPHRIFKEVERALGLEINIGSHTMRHTFVCLAYLLASEMLPKRSAALELVQQMTRHKSINALMNYTTLTKKQCVQIRNGISDWLLGDSHIEELEL